MINKYLILNKIINKTTYAVNYENLKQLYYYSLDFMLQHNLTINKIKKYNYGKIIVIE